MEKNYDQSIDQLKSYLKEQLQAYWDQDWNAYRKLEKKILEIEKFI